MKMLGSLLLFVAVGCGGGSSSDLSDRDPRCVSACTDAPPSLDGAGDVCNTASRDACLDDCEVRIAGVATVCATCLVEDVCFDPGHCDAVSIGDECSNGQCTTTGRTGSCTYPEGNQMARENCERQVNPRREVACTADFRPTSECNTQCGN